MTYEEAHKLELGDKVMDIKTKKQRIVNGFEGTLSHMFIVLDDGNLYRQDQVVKQSAIHK